MYICIYVYVYVYMRSHKTIYIDIQPTTNVNAGSMKLQFDNGMNMQPVGDSLSCCVDGHDLLSCIP